MILGRVGRDPESRYAQGGAQITSFSLATSEAWNDKKTGNRQERTEWHNCVCFGRLAEVAAQYVRKGGQVYVEGSLRTSSWEDRNTGTKRYKTEINVRELQLMGDRPAGGAPASQGAPAAGAQNLDNY